jgi:hypothetical protein
MSQATITTAIHTAFIVSGEHRHVIRFTKRTTSQAYRTVGILMGSGRISVIEAMRLAYQIWELSECEGR